MVVPRVSIHLPPGERACGDIGANLWLFAREESGAQAFVGDVESLARRFPSDESRATYMDMVHERMEFARDGKLPWDFVTQMQIALDVLEIKMPDWHFSGGLMHVRPYFSEPRALPGHLVALRLRAKRPGPIGVDEQDAHAVEASDLLREFETRGFQ